jgi:ABC-type transporter Mla MlaB component
MLKITVSNTNPGTIFVLSGRLAGPWVRELRECWLKREFDESAPCHLDLREVTFIDEAGSTLLSQMCREGVTIQAAGCMTKAIVQNLGRKGGGNHGGIRR